MNEKKTKEEWIRILREWRKSGKSKREYCREKGYKESTNDNNKKVALFSI